METYRSLGITTALSYTFDPLQHVLLRRRCNLSRCRLRRRNNTENKRFITATAGQPICNKRLATLLLTIATLLLLLLLSFYGIILTHSCY